MAATGKAIKWYRSPVSKADMAMLNQKSDLKGALWTLGFLGILATTGTAVVLSSLYLPWYVTVALLFVHGTCWPFLVNGFHELIHESVFKTRRLNHYFLWIYSFLGHHNPIGFWASHTEHHKYTLNPPDDMEEVLPRKVYLFDFLHGGIVNWNGPGWFLTGNLRTAVGFLDGPWMTHLFKDNPVKHRHLRAWAILLLVGHGAIIAASCWFHLRPVVRRHAAIHGQQHPARRHAGQGHRFPPEHPLDRREPPAALPVLEHELPRRAPHVRRGPVLQFGQAAPPDPRRPAHAAQGDLWRVEADLGHPGEAEGGSDLRVHPGIAGEEGG